MKKIDRCIKLLSQKDWQVLRSFWFRHIPDIEHPDQEPDDTLAQSIDLQREASIASTNGDHRFRVNVNPAAILFRESVFVLCKAVRLSCESAFQVVHGLPTWSVSTAYHSSMFALRAFLGLCGISYVLIDGRHFLVDLQPSLRKGKRKQRPRNELDHSEVQLIYVPQIGHREWWMVYQRVIRTSRGFDWRFPIANELPLCDATKFSRHRNELHYRLRWFFDDLLRPEVTDSFGEFSGSAAERVVDSLSESAGSDGMLVLNQVVLGNTLQMLYDLSESSARVKSIRNKISAAIGGWDNHVTESWYSRL